MRTTHCRLYLPGHTVHHIHGRKLGEFLACFPERCLHASVTDLGDGWLEAEIDGETKTGWSHDPARVSDFAADSALGKVTYIPFTGTLASAIYNEDGTRFGSTVLYPAWGATPQGFIDGTLKECEMADGPY
ncbi:hypothetical protein ACT3SZ_12835 [Corynebacterium sp. AOP40-9SA-29]|uniref:hypothetical protein n=1 Tax=Corynebacterium sp. AOP40-9SA-29 TaxID=3457677 RepID=UPI004034487F